MTITVGLVLILLGVALVLGSILLPWAIGWVRKRPTKKAVRWTFRLIGFVCILVALVATGMHRNGGWKGMGPTLSSGFSVTAGERGKGWVAFRHFWNPATAAAVSRSTCGSVCAPIDPVTKTVPASKGWVAVLANSGSCPLRFRVKGKGTVTDGDGRDYGPKGSSQRAGDMTPWPAGPAGALLGYVSDGSPTIVVGKGERITLPPGTELMCAANLRDGSAYGEFGVTMSDFEYLE